MPITIRVGLISCAVVIVAGPLACSAEPGERQGRTEQRIEGPSLAGDAGDAGDACAHAICATGQGLTATCDPCATTLCAQDPYCCTTSWDATCVSEVASICGKSCAAPAPAGDAGASTCAHAVCATGGPLASACESCATQLCAQDAYCCAVAWDATCVSEVASICGKACN
ncbi:MAG: uncharacterized protein JWP87_1425 [Labilithrix sp.]|nr:uncharacterized protein [Labilithrix sp.]